MEEQRRQRAHHEHDRQGLQGEDETGAGGVFRVRERTAAEIAEYRRGAGTRRLLDRDEPVVEQCETGLRARQLEQYRGEDELQGDAAGDRPPGTPRRFSDSSQASARKAA
nr:hypothetical protein [Rhodocyclus purpureus]